ncbi:endonuclease/exonuclease/phosphatase family protein [Rhodococcus sp. NPDC003322]
MSHRFSQVTRRLSVVLALAAVFTAVAPAAAAPNNGTPPGEPNNKKVTVMTRNLYLGTGLTDIVTATTFPQFVEAVTRARQNVIDTDFPARAEALATEIQRSGPDLVGLQEVSLWRTQTPSDLNGPNATTPFQDFLAILQTELAERGLSYTAVATSTNADVEAPYLDPAAPVNPAVGLPLSDIRLTDRDVILARSGVATSNPQNGHYAAQLTVPTAAGRPVTFTRGWTSVDATVNGAAFRFFNTHLETESPAPAIQVAQGAEALGIVNSSPLPVIAVGDYNSDAAGTTTPTYANLIAGGLVDAWPAANRSAAGQTCCQNELLTNPVSENGTRIDLVLTKGDWQAKNATLVGAEPFRASPAPLWASDHAGVVAELKLK